MELVTQRDENATRHFKSREFAISVELLCILFQTGNRVAPHEVLEGLPPDASIVSAVLDKKTDVVVLTVISENFDTDKPLDVVMKRLERWPI